jgi:hypothetical protein
MAYKLIEVAQSRWRAVNAPARVGGCGRECFPQALRGVGVFLGVMFDRRCQRLGPCLVLRTSQGSRRRRWRRRVPWVDAVGSPSVGLGGLQTTPKASAARGPTKAAIGRARRCPNGPEHSATPASPGVQD